LAFMASANAACVTDPLYTFDTPLKWQDGLAAALNNQYPKGQGIVLCSGSDLMARLQTSRDREPTSVHVYQNAWAFSVRSSFMDYYLSAAQDAGATAGSYEAAKALFIQTLNEKTGVDPAVPDRTQDYWLVVYSYQRNVDLPTVYTPFTATWDNMLGAMSNLNKCKWDTASNTDACTAVLSVVFTPDVQNQLKTTTTVQASGCTTSDEFYGSVAGASAECRAFQAEAAALAQIRNTQGGVLEVAQHYHNELQAGRVFTLQEARAYFYIASSCTFLFVGDGNTYDGTDFEYVTRGDVPLDNVGPGIARNLLPHTKKVHPKIALGAWRSRA